MKEKGAGGSYTEYGFGGDINSVVVSLDPDNRSVGLGLRDPLPAGWAVFPATCLGPAGIKPWDPGLGSRAVRRAEPHQGRRITAPATGRPCAPSLLRQRFLPSAHRLERSSRSTPGQAAGSSPLSSGGIWPSLISCRWESCEPWGRRRGDRRGRAAGGREGPGLPLLVPAANGSRARCPPKGAPSRQRPGLSAGLTDWLTDWQLTDCRPADKPAAPQAWKSALGAQLAPTPAALPAAGQAEPGGEVLTAKPEQSSSPEPGRLSQRPFISCRRLLLTHSPPPSGWLRWVLCPLGPWVKNRRSPLPSQLGGKLGPLGTRTGSCYRGLSFFYQQCGHLGANKLVQVISCVCLRFPVRRMGTGVPFPLWSVLKSAYKKNLYRSSTCC